MSKAYLPLILSLGLGWHCFGFCHQLRPVDYQSRSIGKLMSQNKYQAKSGQFSKVNAKTQVVDEIILLTEIKQLIQQLRLDAAEEMISIELSKNPQNYEVKLKLAECYEARGNYAKALTVLQDLPKHLKTLPFYYAYQAYLNLGMKDFAMSQMYYQKLMQAEPTNLNWRLGLANAYDLNGQFELALPVYQQLQQSFLNSELMDFVAARINYINYALAHDTNKVQDATQKS